MTLNPGEEFRIKATPSPELARKLVYLAAQDNGSVLSGGFKSAGAGHRGSDSDKARRTAEALRLARLADPEYQAISQRISNELDLMDEASVHALQEIEQELLELRRERERMLAQAYRDEDGNAIFMAEDESGAFYESGSQVDAEKFARIKDQLRGRPTWDKLQAYNEREDEISLDRDRIHAHDGERERLRDDLAQGAISQKEAEQRIQEIEDLMPERARVSLDALRSHGTEIAATPTIEHSAEEEAALNVRETPSDGSEPAGTQPAASSRTPFQPG